MFTVQPIDTIYGGGAEAVQRLLLGMCGLVTTPGCECDELPLHHHTPLAWRTFQYVHRYQLIVQCNVFQYQDIWSYLLLIQIHIALLSYVEN